MITEALIVILAYLLGSIPTAYILGRLVKGIDIRKMGSGNVGTVNAFRILGLRSSLVILVVDMSKGMFAVLAAQALRLPLPVVLLAGTAAVIGHNWPVFLHFRGWRGSATTLGVLLILIPRELLITLGAASIVFFITRKPLVAVVVLLAPLGPLCYLLGQHSLLSLYTLALPLLVVVTAATRAWRWKRSQGSREKT